MLENIRLSFRGIWSHKLRSILTMLGIIIGIAAIIAIVSTIEGTNEQIKQNLVGSGTNTVTVTLYKDGWNYEFDYEGRADVPPLSDALKAKIAELDAVDSVSFVHRRDYASEILCRGTEMNGVALMGVDDSYFETAGYQVVRGRAFSARELSTRAGRVCVLDRTACSGAFGGDDPIGGTVEVRGIPFTVVGVVTEQSTFEPTITTMSDYYTYSGNKTGKVFVPVSVWPQLYGYDEPETVVVRAVTTDDMTEAGRRTANLINDTLGLKTDDGSAVHYQSEDLLSQAADLQQLASSTNIMLIAIASISLLVGGIGVMNIMLVSVTERTREIGLKKALGARRRQILLQFLTEAVVLSLLGGVVGVLFGIGLSAIISEVAQIPVAFSVPAVVIALAFSMLVGVIFGLLPSVKASRLDPIDALRYE